MMAERPGRVRGATHARLASLAAVIASFACAPPPQGRPLYTPIPESLRSEAMQPVRPDASRHAQVRVNVSIYEGEALVLEPKLATLVDSESTVEFEDDAGRVHVVTVRLGPATPKVGSHPVRVIYERDGERLIEDARHPLPGQVVAFDGPDGLRLELVILQR